MGAVAETVTDQASKKCRGKWVQYTPASYLRHHQGRTHIQDGYEAVSQKTKNGHTVQLITKWEGEADVWDIEESEVNKIAKSTDLSSSSNVLDDY